MFTVLNSINKCIFYKPENTVIHIYFMFIVEAFSAVAIYTIFVKKHKSLQSNFSLFVSLIIVMFL